MRGHQPIVIEEFNGLWMRGGVDSTPQDHFSDCNNVQYIQSGFKTRDGLDPYLPYGNVIRIYTYSQDIDETLLILNGSGNIFHSGSPTPFVPILTVMGMTDFAFVNYAGRAYITPSNGVTGVQDEFLYVYKGDGTPARKAGGNPPSNAGMAPFIVTNNEFEGEIDEGIHVLGVINANVSDEKSIIGPEVFAVIQAPGNKQATAYNIPVSADPTTTKRLIVSTKAIKADDWNPDLTTYQYFLVTTINDNTTTSIGGSYTDASLTVDLTAYLTTPDSGAPTPPTTSTAMLVANNNTDGGMDNGFHLFGVVYETDTGFLTGIGPEVLAGQTVEDGTKAITISNIPVSPDTFVTKRRLVATKTISLYDGNQQGYQFFFIPDATLEDNTTTTWTGSFFDADLLEDASHLFDIFSEIPAGVGLNTYHNRLLLWTSFEDQSVVRVSNPGDPETFSQIDGLIIIPLDGRPVTNAQEYRDILYVTKEIRTFAVNDSGDVPSSWPITVLDEGLGSSVHGISLVLDSGGVSVDYLIIANFGGVFLFNGSYLRPELSWKIKDLWNTYDRTQFQVIQVYNDSIAQIVYISLPDFSMLIADYSNGLDAKNVRWAKWTFNVQASTITLVLDDPDTARANRLVIGSAGSIVVPPPLPSS